MVTHGLATHLVNLQGDLNRQLASGPAIIPHVPHLHVWKKNLQACFAMLWQPYFNYD